MPAGRRVTALALGLWVAAMQTVPVMAQASDDVDVTSGAIDADVAPDMVPDIDPAIEPDLLPDEALVAALPVALQRPYAPEDMPQGSELAPALSPRPTLRDTWAVPTARWDNHPEGRRWTTAVLAALRGPGAPLLEVEPRDIRTWCPGYLSAAPAQRAAFWTGLVSVLAWHESTHNQNAVGGGGQWFGLVQIAPGTARWRNCDVRSGQALLNGPANLRCGIRIMALTVPRDGVVSEGMEGVAADWGPFHSSRKREEMRNWVRRQDYCRPPTRPVMRPAGLARDTVGARPMPRPEPRASAAP
ncbi:transglycosylase SLT domain-containing protein [Gymnodinialimonas sp. 2305UL16-5]|uniref:transglycosylase SLT domain-containing protein n=1 Tax=Gymnodinialimonas mytili TaxID=3126503 RepID=UPI0030AC771A